MENTFLRTSLVLGFGGKDKKERSVEHKMHKIESKMIALYNPVFPLQLRKSKLLQITLSSFRFSFINRPFDTRRPSFNSMFYFPSEDPKKVVATVFPYPAHALTNDNCLRLLTGKICIDFFPLTAAKNGIRPQNT